MNDYKNGAQFFSSFKLSFVIICKSRGTARSAATYGCLASLSASPSPFRTSIFRLRSETERIDVRTPSHVDCFTLLMIMPPSRCIGVELYFSEYFVFVFTNFSSPFCLSSVNISRANLSLFTASASYPHTLFARSSTP